MDQTLMGRVGKAVQDEIKSKIETESVTLDKLIQSQNETHQEIEENCYGFKVKSTVGVKTNRTEINEKRERIGNLGIQLSELANFFAEMKRKTNLNPIAVIPAKTFDALCEDFNLYRFERISKDGEVPIADSSFNILKVAKEQRSTMIGAAIFCFLFSFVVFVFSTPINALLAGFTTFSLVALGAVICIWMESTSKTRMPFFLTHAAICKIFWPNKLDQLGKSRQEIKISFPNPPDETMKVLQQLKKSELQVMVAVIPQAIRIDSTELKQKMEFYIEEQKRLARLDPIVYYKDRGKDFVAIFAQFGNFADEKKVLKWVKKKGMNPYWN